MKKVLCLMLLGLAGCAGKDVRKDAYLEGCRDAASSVIAELTGLPVPAEEFQRPCESLLKQKDAQKE